MSFSSFVISQEIPSTETVVLKPQGELDVQTAPQLKEALNSSFESGNRFVAMDLREVSFIDSTTLGVLIGALKRAKAVEGRLVLVCHDPAILRLIQITGLHQIFQLRGDLDEALAYLRTGEEQGVS